METSAAAWVASQSASAVLPAAVGPQTTRTTGALLAPKASLELRPRELDDGGAAVNVVRGKRSGVERTERRNQGGQKNLKEHREGFLDVLTVDSFERLSRM